MLGPNGSCIAGCAERAQPAAGPCALRARLGETSPLPFEDRFQGRQSSGIPLPENVVLKRRDGWYAYHLAVVVDDAAQGITHVVRGADLLSMTPLHKRLQALLDLPSPEYAHCPVLRDAEGNKLSKQTGAAAIDPACAEHNLRRALKQMEQAEPPAAARTARDILSYAVEHWQPATLRQPGAAA